MFGVVRYVLYGSAVPTAGIGLLVQNLELTISVDEANESIAVPTTVGTRLGLGGNGAVLIRKQRGQVQAATVRQAVQFRRRRPVSIRRPPRRSGFATMIGHVEAADPAVATRISVAPVPQLSIRGGEALSGTRSVIALCWTATPSPSRCSTGR